MKRIPIVAIATVLLCVAFAESQSVQDEKQHIEHGLSRGKRIDLSALSIERRGSVYHLAGDVEIRVWGTGGTEELMVLRLFEADYDIDSGEITSPPPIGIPVTISN
jgi:hypothetical protein